MNKKEQDNSLSELERLLFKKLTAEKDIFLDFPLFYAKQRLEIIVKATKQYPKKPQGIIKHLEKCSSMELGEWWSDIRLLFSPKAIDWSRYEHQDGFKDFISFILALPDIIIRQKKIIKSIEQKNEIDSTLNSLKKIENRLKCVDLLPENICEEIEALRESICAHYEVLADWAIDDLEKHDINAQISGYIRRTNKTKNSEAAFVARIVSEASKQLLGKINAPLVAEIVFVLYRVNYTASDISNVRRKPKKKKNISSAKK